LYTKFGRLIIWKIIKIIATRCQILGLKCTKFDSWRLSVCLFVRVVSWTEFDILLSLSSHKWPHSTEIAPMASVRWSRMGWATADFNNMQSVEGQKERERERTTILSVHRSVLRRSCTKAQQVLRSSGSRFYRRKVAITM